jgi:hypothetical protein
MSTTLTTYHMRMTEAELQAAVVKMAGLMGYRSYHTKFSVGSDRGWPDLVLCRPPRLVVIELKRTGKHPTPAQDAWLEALAACGIETYVFTPVDWHAGMIDEVLR